MTSSASGPDIAGKMVANRRASIVLPAPGAPTNSALCPPAAATSSARRACAWPRTSERSTVWRPSPRGTVRAGGDGRHVPRKNPTTSASDGAPTTSMPSTSAASVAFISGTTTPRSPSAAAAIDMESTPGVDTSVPLSESSPTNPHRRTPSAGACPVATSTLIATARSSPGPSFRMLPGDRFTTTRRSGHSSLALSTAGRMRSRASWTAAPGSPVNVSDGRPRPTCASTTTGRPRTPTTATPMTRPYTVARP